jgi:hypothetical protein
VAAVVAVAVAEAEAAAAALVSSCSLEPVELATLCSFPFAWWLFVRLAFSFMGAAPSALSSSWAAREVFGGAIVSNVERGLKTGNWCYMVVELDSGNRLTSYGRFTGTSEAKGNCYMGSFFVTGC